MLNRISSHIAELVLPPSPRTFSAMPSPSVDNFFTNWRQTSSDGSVGNLILPPLMSNPPRWSIAA